MRTKFLIFWVLGLGLVTNLAWSLGPWKPNIRIPNHEGVGIRPTIQKKLDPVKQKRFEEVLARGRFFFSIGKYVEAKNFLAQATSIEPHHQQAGILFARTLLTLGYLRWNHSLILRSNQELRHLSEDHPEDQQLGLLIDLTEELLRRMDFAQQYGKKK